MKIEEIKELDELIWKKLNEDSENVLDFFKEKWKKLNFDDKKLFANFRGKFNPSIIYGTVGWTDINIEIQNVYRSQINEFINKELSGQPVLIPLKCGKNIKPVDIVCVFKLLYELEYIDNTLPEIEAFIMHGFNFKNRKTIESYLNDPGKLKTAARKFKKLVDQSTLVKS